jgi:RHS repeat-associated protein
VPGTQPGTDAPSASSPLPLSPPISNDAAERTEERAEARRARPEARAERERSRSAHRDLGRAAAIALIAEKFPTLSERLAWRPLRLERDQKVSEYLDRHAARVKASDGTSTIAVSSWPLRSAAGNGLSLPVNHALVEDGARLKPVNPYVPTSIGRALGDGVELPGIGLSLRVVGGDPTAAASVINDKAFWPDVAVDTDYMVLPIPRGFQTFHILRSSRSPEALYLDLKLPSGAVLRPAAAAPGAFEVVSGSNVVANVSAPVATDAQGAPVDVSLEATDGRLRLNVAHRSADVAYPILVDPEVVDRHTYQTSQPINWTWRNNTGGRIASAKTVDALHMWNPGGITYANGERDYWYYFLGGDAYISRAEFGFVSHESKNTCVYAGIAQNNGSWSTAGTWHEPENPGAGGSIPSLDCDSDVDYQVHCLGNPICGPDDNPINAANQAIWGIQMMGAGGHAGFSASMGQMVVFLRDLSNPTLQITPSAPPGNWTPNNQNFQIYVTDAGLGIKRVRLYAAQSPNWSSRTTGIDNHWHDYGCIGHVGSRCGRERYWPNGVWATTAGLRDGTNVITADVEDAMGRPGTHGEWTVRMDRRAPKNPELSGPVGASSPLLTDSTGYLDIDVKDQDGEVAPNDNSGISQVGVNWDGQLLPATTTRPGCSGQAGCVADLRLGLATLTSGSSAHGADGSHTLSVTARDGAGLTNAQAQTRTVRIDRNPPQVTASNNFTPAWRKPPGTLTIGAQDAGSGVRSVVLTSGSRTWRRDQTCSSATECANPFPTQSIPYELEEGTKLFRARAIDGVGHEWSYQWLQRVDGTAPTASIGLTEGDPDLNAQNVRINVRDATESGAAVSGVKTVTVQIGNQSPVTYSPSCTSQTSTEVPTGSYLQCPSSHMVTHPVPSNAWASGIPTITVTTVDQAGNQRSRTTKLYRVDLDVNNRDRLGLENYFGYESFETGSGTSANVNLDTRNVVWHSLPIVNPGRGLSTVVNLTYNSLDNGAFINSLVRGTEGAAVFGTTVDRLAGIGYGEAGMGFSLGISGMTRLNEPLVGVGLDESGQEITSPSSIRFTDADGTRHHLDPYGGDVYVLRGANEITLRRFSNTNDTRRWIAVRKDGVAYFFDRLGYQTFVRDRNGNELRFEYERYSKATGLVADCAVASPPAWKLCSQRVVRVVDAVGVAAEPTVPAPGQPRDPVAERRSLKIEYNAGPILPMAPGTTPTSSVLYGAVGGKPGRIKRIVDHAGRATDFAYDDEGYLIRIDQGEILPGYGRIASTYEKRSMHLGYGWSGPNRRLAWIDDRRAASTFLSYEPTPTTETALTRPMPASNMTLRNGELWRFDDDGGRLRVRAPGDRDVFYSTDGEGRPQTVWKPDGTYDSYGWHYLYNTLTDINRGGTGNDPGAHTYIAHDRHGNPTMVIDPRGKATTYSYRYGDENGPSPDGTDDGSQPVSDLIGVDRPGDNDLTFELDDLGNVESTQASGYAAATAEYDQHGQLSSETDEVGNVTEYEQYDESGMPQLVIDAKGTATAGDDSDGKWRYRYDRVGNVLTVADPRGDTPQVNAPFTTWFEYDAFDRVVHEVHPKRSNLGAESTWISREHEYDENGNRVATIDGNGKRSEWEYTPTDQVELARTPATEHVGESGEAREVTRYEYDGRDNLVKVISPRGEQTAVVDDYTTLFEYDDLDQKVVERRLSRGGVADDELVTTFRYDTRGNVVRIADPRQNNGNAQSGAVDTDPRWEFAYDAADNRTDVIERSGSAERRTRTEYDDNNRARTVVPPKGMDGEVKAPDAAEYATTYTYDSRDEVLTERRGENRLTVYVRNEDGSVKRIVRPRGTATEPVGDFTTSYEYDPTGAIRRITLPEATTDPVPDRTIEYERNAVGDPILVRDPKGSETVNTFFDTGHVRTTTRPGMWVFEPGGGAELRLRDYDEWLTYDGGGAPSLPTGAGGGGDFGRVRPQQLPGIPATAAGDTRFGYDDEMRLTSSTHQRETPSGADEDVTIELERDGLGRIQRILNPIDFRNAATRYRYDRNGNLGVLVDAEDNETRFTYDQFDRWVQRSEPGGARSLDDWDDPSAYVANVFKAEWDDNGNLTKSTDPRDFSTTMTYDGFDQRVSVTDPEFGVTVTGYDEHGNRVCERRPRSEQPATTPCAAGPFSTTYGYNRHDEVNLVSRTRAVPNQADLVLETSYTRDEHGNVERTDAPGENNASGVYHDRVVRRTFDAHDRVLKTIRGSGDTTQTSVREYDAVGNLRRVVKPRGLDADGDPVNGDDGAGQPTAAAQKHATVYVTNEDNLLTGLWQPWGDRDADDELRYHTHYQRNELGQVDWIDHPYHTDESRTVRVAYEYNKAGWIQRSSDEHWVDPQSLPQRDFSSYYDYDRVGRQTQWSVAQPEPNGGSSTFREVLREYYPSGALKRRTARRAYGDQSPRAYTYSYNGDGQLYEMRDQQTTREWGFGYDDAGRLTAVNERWSEGKDTRYVVDRDGNVTNRYTDGEITSGDPGYSGGKRTLFEYDSLGDELRMTVRPGSDARTTSTTYWPSGLRHERVKPNGTEEEWHHDRIGRVQDHRRDPDNGPMETEDYTYDANGNRTRDERGVHVFNSRDQLVKWTRESERASVDGDVVEYVHNGSGSLLRKHSDFAEPGDQDETITYNVRGSRLRTLTATVGGASSTRYFRYDPAGNMTCSGALSDWSGTGSDPCVGGKQFRFDDFGRMVGSKGSGVGDDDVSYVYDGLDRRDYKCINGTGANCSGGTTRNYAYIGTTDMLSLERATGDVTKRYDYNSQLERVGQERQEGSGNPSYRAYNQDANGSVIGLEGSDGAVSCGDRYDYDPYGSSLSRECGSSPEGADNSFRFQGFHFDPQAASYDMHAREYQPEIGRFLSLDMFEDSIGDMTLQLDPVTQDRYAFAAGNPVNVIEFDGHGPAPTNDGPSRWYGKNNTPPQRVNERNQEIWDTSNRTFVPVGAQEAGPYIGGGGGGGSLPGAAWEAAKNVATDTAGDAAKAIGDALKQPVPLAGDAIGRFGCALPSNTTWNGPLGTPRCETEPATVGHVVSFAGLLLGETAAARGAGALCARVSGCASLPAKIASRATGGARKPSVASRGAANAGPGWFPTGTNKIPREWSGPNMTSKFGKNPDKAGFVWRAPRSQNSVRIDKGNPASPWPSQRVDHVVVNSGGQIVGRDGTVLPPGTRIKDAAEEAHIPLSEWQNWTSWNGR